MMRKVCEKQNLHHHHDHIIINLMLPVHSIVLLSCCVLDVERQQH